MVKNSFRRYNFGVAGFNSISFRSFHSFRFVCFVRVNCLVLSRYMFSSHTTSFLHVPLLSQFFLLLFISSFPFTFLFLFSISWLFCVISVIFTAQNLIQIAHANLRSALPCAEIKSPLRVNQFHTLPSRIGACTHNHVSVSTTCP